MLGTAYHSGAVLSGDGDGSDHDHSTPAELPEPATDYVPTAAPGHRMPHLWLAPGRSTLDAFGEWFTLFTPDPTHWEPQAASSRLPLRVESLPGEYADHCGLRPHGALLVRPDGHIGARWSDRAPGGSSLRHALAGISRSTPPSASSA